MDKVFAGHETTLPEIEWKEIVLHDWQKMILGAYFWPGGAYLYQKSTETQDDTNSRRLRLWCHILVEHLPQAGLDEAYEVLRDMYAFYAYRPPAAPLPSEPKKMPAKIGKSYERPPFHVDED